MTQVHPEVFPAFTANRVLQSFAPTSEIFFKRGSAYVRFRSRDDIVEKRWQCRGQDFYPTWHKEWPGGGTASTALSQLVRWLQDKPVLPLASWEYWATEKIKLLPLSAVEELRIGGYPEHAHCVLCGMRLDHGLDWWSLNNVTGPCCHWTNGCRQKGKDA